ncbi:DUF1398 domain-containing protein [Xanthocytophaga agilis]|uniref:DUF1398 family protein n=1 Tax=Xanthocytophaga agilis TaxID=3048010 RepID=A0AAE3R0K4_9BACT|nr:DUF1398 family protein [Xanthocytophaga agilis]MDJ1499489.1 DUF1398 family protein [Xanthocytophaga agilis]
MFTVEQVKSAHTKVKSGADFPAYIQEIKQLGVTAYETWVTDSHTNYFGKEGYQTQSKPMYDKLPIALTTDKQKFSYELKLHQQGHSDYYTFCKVCAETGIEKWFVRLDTMTCTYYDTQENEIVVETIPG